MSNWHPIYKHGTHEWCAHINRHVSRAIKDWGKPKKFMHDFYTHEFLAYLLICESASLTEDFLLEIINHDALRAQVWENIKKQIDINGSTFAFDRYVIGSDEWWGKFDDYVWATHCESDDETEYSAYDDMVDHLADKLLELGIPLTEEYVKDVVCDDLIANGVWAIIQNRQGGIA